MHAYYYIIRRTLSVQGRRRRLIAGGANPREVPAGMRQSGMERKVPWSVIVIFTFDSAQSRV